jgi:pimeloyl-ACP methyl ester carboxylesterase
MKARAGVVGRTGLAPLLNELSDDIPAIRVHLLGHSFGARLVSYTLRELHVSEGRSAVKSLFLIQGAFSHFAFAETLPFDRTRKGDLAGMSSRVDGPLLTTFSAFDKAVGYAYPVASVLANDDAAAAEDLMYRWEGMGCDGAQAVYAAGESLGDPGCSYALPKGKWLNLDGNAVITQGGLPAGAHSDIIHPQIAWAALKAAGIY